VEQRKLEIPVGDKFRVLTGKGVAAAIYLLLDGNVIALLYSQ